MSRRMIKQVPGEYVPGPEGGYFTIKDIPATPRFQRIQELNPETRRISEYLELLLGCPHCLVDVEFHLPIADARQDIFRDFADSTDRAYRQRVKEFETYEAKVRAPREVPRMVMEAMEEWYE